MGFFLPAAVISGLSLSHHFASRELDEIYKEADAPLFGFWCGLILGLFGGVWIGANFHRFFNVMFEIGEHLFSKIVQLLTGVDESAKSRSGGGDGFGSSREDYRVGSSSGSRSADWNSWEDSCWPRTRRRGADGSYDDNHMVGNYARRPETTHDYTAATAPPPPPAPSCRGRWIPPFSAQEERDGDWRKSGGEPGRFADRKRLHPSDDAKDRRRPFTAKEEEAPFSPLQESTRVQSNDGAHPPPPYSSGRYDSSSSTSYPGLLGGARALGSRFGRLF